MPSASPTGVLQSAASRPYRVRWEPSACTIQRATPPLRLAKSRLRRLLACIAPAGAKVSPFGLTAPPEVEPRRLRRYDEKHRHLSEPVLFYPIPFPAR